MKFNSELLKYLLTKQPPTHPRTHPLTHAPIHPPTHPLTHPSTHPPIHPPTPPPTHPSTHPLTHPPIHLPTHPLIHPFTPHPPTPDCGTISHKKCFKFIANLCGVNQKILNELLETVNNTTTITTTTTTPSNNNTTPIKLSKEHPPISAPPVVRRVKEAPKDERVYNIIADNTKRFRLTKPFVESFSDDGDRSVVAALNLVLLLPA